ncbi:geranylgeranylglycerol-phosphate geranylgeranyltransferase [Crocinitomix catalasitica]|uniref:geranylgeranylglycerol-phosphate geranylgeranyltransferase n=1 Tax=Crocinitomix catalasitica TaxID=184607 RepID=UPI000A02AF8B|nr:geranylgeranylglycerol-phosphate geranylgeranyltransferase [Crocinitomix catalasitica]
MKTVYQFFRLIRFGNLLVMVLTMLAFYALLFNYSASRQSEFFILSNQNLLAERLLIDQIGLMDFNFLLLIFSVLCIGASGNIINDYFDVKADRVNKPERLIIDKYIKRRWAIIFNWTLNILGLFIATYLSYRFDNWWIFLISFTTINLLYFYSAVFKRKFFVGNILVAFLTALVPFYVFIFGAFSSFSDSSPLAHTGDHFIQDNIWVVLLYCFFAFMVNLIREIIKDMADVKGDLLLGSKTLPIKIGFAKSKILLGVLYILVVIPIIYYVIALPLYPDTSNNALIFTYLLWLVIITLMISIVILFSKNTTKHYLMASNFIKFAMLFGVISALFYS